MSSLLTKNEALEKQNSELGGIWKQAARVLTDGTDINCNADISALRRRLVSFRETYADADGNNKASSSPHSDLSSPNDLTFDKTDEGNLNAEQSRLRSGTTWYRGSPKNRRKRTRSKSANQHGRVLQFDDMNIDAPRKRSKEAEDMPDPDPTPVVRRSTRKKSSLNKSFSEGHLVKSKDVRHGFGETPLKSPYTLRNYASTVSLSSRTHLFTSSTVLRPGDNYCSECAKRCHSKGRIGFAQKVYTCTECRITLCSDCKIDPPLPCVPKCSTPRKHEKGFLADFTPKTPPMIPHLIVHCIREIERRGLDEVGLYRVPGSEGRIIQLAEHFLWGKTLPNLVSIGDIHILTSCVKRFLLWLKEPVIPHSSWHDFSRGAANAEESGNFEALAAAIGSLPPPNRDTLAFLCIHLLNVIREADKNKMPADNIAMVFGPTVVGNSSENAKQSQQLKEHKRQMLDISDPDASIVPGHDIGSRYG